MKFDFSGKNEVSSLLSTSRYWVSVHKSAGQNKCGSSKIQISVDLQKAFYIA